MELLITTEMVTAILFVGLAVVVGYRGNKLIGAIVFALFAVLLSSLFVASIPFLYSHLVDDVSAWIGSAGQATLILVAIATLLGYQGDSLMGAVMLGLGEVTVTENESA